MTTQLTKPQITILKEMKEKGAFLVTNEGANYKAWLEYPDKTKKYMNRNTGSALHRLGYIKNMECPSHHFYYELSGKRF